MVFVIQNTQNRDNAALQLKLDELIRVLKGANNDMMTLEDESIDQLEQLRESYRELSKRGEHAQTKSANIRQPKSEQR